MLRSLVGSEMCIRDRILSAAWMLNLSFDLDKEAFAIEVAVEAALEGGHTTGDLGGSLSTSEVGSWIADYVSQENHNG